ncbi:hypothetical protein QEN19_003717 [Hanseniaspora menglaensis]
MPKLSLPAPHRFDLWKTLVNDYFSQAQLVENVIVLNSEINRLCTEKLFHSIRFTRYGHRTLNSDSTSGFKTTLINGFCNLNKSENKKDQNDYILHTKIGFLLFGEKTLSAIAKHTKILIVDSDAFYDADLFSIFEELIERLGAMNNVMEKVSIQQTTKTKIDYFFKNYLFKKDKFPCLKSLLISSAADFASCISLGRFETIKYLELSCIDKPVEITFPINELVINDSETLFNTSIKEPKNIEKLSFTFHHDVQNDFIFKNHISVSLLEQIQWNKIKNLEIKYNCLLRETDSSCSCFESLVLSRGYFSHLDEISKLTIAQSLRDYSSNIERFEMNQISILSYWDDCFVSILTKIPTTALAEKLTVLAVNQYPSMNGHAKNITDGYYTHRVKKLYQLHSDLTKQTALMSILLQRPLELFKKLEILQLPHFLQSLVQIPILSNDLLWNGCQCSVCTPNLEHIDRYMHDHLWFRQNISNSGGFGSGVSDKFQELENGEMFAFMLLPIDRYCEDFDLLVDGNGFNFNWDFHDDLYNGQNMKLIHYEDDHHRNNNCDLNEKNYEEVVLHTFKHFLDLYIDAFLFTFPRIKIISLSGFVYRVDMDRYGTFMLHD